MNNIQQEAMAELRYLMRNDLKIGFRTNNGWVTLYRYNHPHKIDLRVMRRIRKEVYEELLKLDDWTYKYRIIVGYPGGERMLDDLYTYEEAIIECEKNKKANPNLCFNIVEV